MSSETAVTVSDPAEGTGRRVVFAGGHGQIALLAQRRLAAEGHRPVGLIRKPEHADDLRAVGAEPVVFDLESQTAAELAEILSGADALVFAAGAGPNSGPGRKMTVDRDGAILLADAAELAGVRRYVVISALAADDFVVGLGGGLPDLPEGQGGGRRDRPLPGPGLDHRPSGRADRHRGHRRGPGRRQHRTRADPA